MIRSSFYKSFPVRILTIHNFPITRSVAGIFPLTKLFAYSITKVIRLLSTKCSNYYDILGVTPKASQQEIKAAYFKLSKLYHPDVNKDGSESIQKFREVTEAYHLLSNAQFRLQYNKEAFDPEILETAKREVYTGRSSNYNYYQWNKNHYNELFRQKEYKRSQKDFERLLKEQRDRNFQRAYNLVAFTAISLILMLMIGGIERSARPRLRSNQLILSEKKLENNNRS